MSRQFILVCISSVAFFMLTIGCLNYSQNSHRYTIEARKKYGEVVVVAKPCLHGVSIDLTGNIVVRVFGGGHAFISARDGEPIGQISEESMYKIAQAKDIVKLSLVGAEFNGRSCLSFLPQSSLRELNIAFSSIVDAEWVHLSKCTDLEVLNLTGLSNCSSAVTAAAELPKLKTLVLNSSDFDDSDLKLLVKMSHLDTIFAIDTKISDIGIQEYLKAGGRATIIRSETKSELGSGGLI